MRQILEAPSRRRRAEFLAAVSRSRELHRGLVTPPRTVEAFERYLARLRGPAHIGYWIRTNENELAGVINISEIVRGAFQSAYLGYYAFVPHDGHGRMSQGLRAVLGEVFRVHRLIGSKQTYNLAMRLRANWFADSGFDKKAFRHDTSRLVVVGAITSGGRSR
jgi:[ribosomal protein S5]-alanine N-acetyltransferase